MAESAAILALSAVWGLGWNAVDPRGVALGRPLPRRAETDPRYLPHARARELYFASRAVFADVRSRAGYERGHIPGALHLPAEAFAEAFGRVGARFRPEDEIVLYCDGPSCTIADSVVPKLLAAGFHRVRIYEGGIEEWAARGEQVRTGEAE